MKKQHPLRKNLSLLYAALIAFVCIALLQLLITSREALTRTETFANIGTTTAYIYAAGDIADCTPGAQQTADLLDNKADAILTLGDTVYTNRPDRFSTCFAPWGK